MVRGIFILVICSVLATAVAWFVSPEFIERNLPPLARLGITEATPSAPVQTSAIPNKVIGKKSGHIAVKSAPTVVAEELVPDAIPVVEAPAPAPVPEKPVPVPLPPPPVIQVSVENVALYSSNSHEGRVVTMLKKGEIVEPKFKINNQGQEWTYVNVADQTVSGFLQSGSIRESERPAEHAAP